MYTEYYLGVLPYYFGQKRNNTKKINTLPHVGNATLYHVACSGVEKAAHCD